MVKFFQSLSYLLFQTNNLDIQLCAHNWVICTINLDMMYERIPWYFVSPFQV